MDTNNNGFANPQQPVQPTVAPVQPAVAPVQPAVAPVQPAAVPVQPVQQAMPQQSVQPAVAPMQPVQQAMPQQPVQQPVPQQSVQPAAAPMQPAAAPAPKKEKVKKEKIKKEKKPVAMKTWHIIYGSVITVLLLGIIGLGVFTRISYVNAVADTKADYIEAKENFDEAYELVTSEQDAWENELREKQEELNAVNAELQAIYDERQAELDAESARWNALSQEEKDAEEIGYAYNEMVAYLRANNPEYAEIYVKYAQYLDKDVFNLGKEDSLAYTELYRRKCEIEQAYLEEHPF